MTTAAEQVEVKESPILFSGAMVNAILEGRKTQTRRVLKTQPLEILDKNRGAKLVKVTRQWNGNRVWFGLTQRDPNRGVAFRCSHGEVGDRLWVRETYGVFGLSPSGVHLGYKARLPEGKTLAHTDGGLDIRKVDKDAQRWAMKKLDSERWKSGRFMPRWASRISLEITDVRVERLQQISEADAIAEGVRTLRDGSGTYAGREGPRNLVTPWPTAKEAFADLWDTINAKREGCAWANNPWVWVIEFKKL